MQTDFLAAHGYALLPAVISTAECAALGNALPATMDGARNLLDQPWCATLAQQLRHHPLLAPLIPAAHVAVQCTYFAKSATHNWLVGLHQDLSICVAEKVEDAPLRGWSEKEGKLYVQPPQAVLEQLLAVRVHLDVCGPDDGPLHVVSGSHRHGIIAAAAASALRSQHGTVLCTAEPGGVLAMRPLLLHASSKASGASLRRVLHFIFGPPSLPYSLRWRKIV